MTKWEPLRPGDIVDVVAPSSQCTKYELNQAGRFLEKFGLIPRIPAGIFGRDVFAANTDKKRFEYFKKAIQAKDSKAIWSIRGGYGCSRILPMVAKIRKPKRPKLFLGYSDNTIMHQFFNQVWDWPSIHSSVLAEMGRGEGSRQEINDLQRILYGFSKKLNYNGLFPLNKSAREKKTLRASVIGGNLTVLVSLLGTPWQASGKGRILMIEDIGERGYRVDRMLVQLEQAGFFKGMRALIFGDFVGGEEEDSVYLWKDAQKRFASDMKFPVFRGLPCGHTTMQRPLMLNTPSELKCGARASLIVDSGFKSR